MALTGQCTAHHGRLIQGALELMALLERQIADLDEQIRQATEPFAPQLEPLHSIPGIKAITARDIIAEIGAEMRPLWLGQALVVVGGRLAGQQRECGQTTEGAHGQRQSLSASGLGACAWAAGKTPTCIGRTFRR